ncbi:MAG TPA: biosynthetic-type acetolactate synthase large subunit [Chthonomonadales bacterium]|nr:biosynthetic-type acetolactate synthase large subunit [Chthonomonadales bacterium]
MQMSGAQIWIACLRAEGVRHIFGYPGGVLLPIYDALYDCRDIEHILVRHEQGAAHMADGYARATGGVGVCLATSGPGATNLVTGIANAFMDSIPVVCITGQVRTAVIGKDAFQEADITGITMPITKHNFLLKNPADLPEVMAKAFHIARTGRPGPVLVDIPQDVSRGVVEWDPERYPRKVDMPSYRPTTRGHEMQVKKAAALIADAERPVLYVGGGAIASGAHAEVTELAERANILVTTTLLGKGALDENHPLSIGMLGMHGTAYANHAVHECDLLIAVGARFDDRVTGRVDGFARHARVIHIDIDPAEIGKVRAAEVPIVGDVKTVLQQLLRHVEPRPWSAWNDQVVDWRRAFPLVYPRDGKLYAEYIIEQIGEATGWDCILATDVGQHQMWAAQYFRCRRPRQWITSGGLGTMGFGLPAAIGAQLACPDKRVVCLSGDGSFQMCAQELMTATVYGLPIVTVVANNRTLGMVRQWQELFYEKRYSHVDLEASPDFVKLVDAYGGVGLRVTSPEQVRPALDEALAVRDRPVVIDAVIPTEENVYPMIPAGQSVQEMRIRENLEHLKASVHADAEAWSFADQERVLEEYIAMSRQGRGSEG